MIRIDASQEIINEKPFFSAHGSDIRFTQYGYVFRNVDNEFYIITQDQMRNMISGFTGVVPTLNQLRQTQRLHG